MRGVTRCRQYPPRKLRERVKIAVPHLCASKFALAGFSEGMRAAVKGDGVYVTTVCPGLMRTGSPRHAEFKGKLEDEYAWFTAADSLPGLSIDARRAACMIVDSCVHGDAELIMPATTWVAVKANALMPGIASDVLSLSERLLPQADGSDGEKRRGAEISRDKIPAWLAARDDKAAWQNNEVKDEMPVRPATWRNRAAEPACASGRQVSASGLTA